MNILLIFIFFLNFSSYARFENSVAYRTSKIQLEKLNQKNITSLEFIILGKGSSLQSRFGHAALRLVDDDSNPLNDIIVEYIAAVDDDELAYVDGLAGNYPVRVSLTNIKQYIVSSGIKSFRSVSSYEINTNDVSIHKYLGQLKETFYNPKKLGQYYFLSRNCAGVLQEQLMDVGVLNARYHFENGKSTPSLMIKYWIDRNQVVAKEHMLVDPQHHYRTIVGKMNKGTRRIKNIRNFTIKQLSNKLSNLDLIQLLHAKDGAVTVKQKRDIHKYLLSFPPSERLIENLINF